MCRLVKLKEQRLEHSPSCLSATGDGFIFDLKEITHLH